MTKTTPPASPDKPQSDKFKDPARAFECDDDPERFRERAAKLVKHKPVAQSDA